MKKGLIAVILFCLGAPSLMAQENDVTISIYRHHPTVQKSKFSFVWGWNRGWFTESDIHFSGDDYDFTLGGVEATDRQSDFALDPYFHPLYVTIPQTNAQFRYNFRGLWSLAINVDHMKYVMKQNSQASIDGRIDRHGAYQGTYNGETIELRENLLTYEHTDGLNFVNVELSRFHALWNPQGGKFDDFGLYLNVGAGIGFVLPKTNSKLLNEERHDAFHLAGYGAAVKSGLHLGWKRFFVASELKAGYLNMPDIRTTQHKSDRASQHFGFVQNNILFGVTFALN